jgi:uncharacterized protein with HEPN domain
MRDHLAHRDFDTTHAVVKATIDNDLDALLDAAQRPIEHTADPSDE